MIIDHISGTVRREIVAKTGSEMIDSGYVAFILALYLISKIAVPCFVMLSGAFLIPNENNGDFRRFYKKSYNKIGIHGIFFSILYVCFSLLKKIIKVFLYKSSPLELLTPFADFFQGVPYYHLWYLFTLIGLYCAVPVIIKIKKDINERAFAIISWGFFFVSIISGWTSSFLIEWSTSKSICYVGYLLVGYQLRKLCTNRSRLKGILLILAGIACAVVFSLLGRRNLLNLNKSGGMLSYGNNLSPIVAVSAILIFAGFSFLRIPTNKSVEKISKLTFYIYLIHAGVWDIIYALVFNKKGIVLGANAISCLVIPTVAVMVFFISYVLSHLYLKVYDHKKSFYSDCS